MATRLAPIHPGEILLTEFLEPLALSQYRLAHDLSVPPRRINEILHGKRAITADTALRLGRYFGMSPQFYSTCSRDSTWRSNGTDWVRVSGVRLRSMRRRTSDGRCRRAPQSSATSVARCGRSWSERML